MSTLFELSAEYQSLLDAIGEDGELSAQLDRLFADFADRLEAKADGYGAAMEEVSTRMIGRQAAIDRLLAAQQVDGKAHQRMRGRMQQFMQDRAIPKIQTDRYKFTICANGGSLPVKLTVAPEELPSEYQRVAIAADPIKLRKALEAGVRIGGAALGERGTHLRIT
jgi:hypothetical protein